MINHRSFSSICMLIIQVLHAQSKTPRSRDEPVAAHASIEFENVNMWELIGTTEPEDDCWHTRLVDCGKSGLKGDQIKTNKKRNLFEERKRREINGKGRMGLSGGVVSWRAAAAAAASKDGVRQLLLRSCSDPDPFTWRPMVVRQRATRADDWNRDGGEGPSRRRH